MNYGLVELSTLYRAGVTTTEITRLCGHPAPWVYKRLAEAGIEPNRRPQKSPRYMSVEDDPLLPVIQNMRRQGFAFLYIASKLGKSLEYVHRRLTPQLRAIRPKVRPTIPKRKKRRPVPPVAPEEVENFLALHATGLTTIAISKLTSRATSTIRAHLKLAGLEPLVIDANRCSGLWPKINTTMKRALKGRKFDSLVFPVGSLIAAQRNGARM